MNPQTQNQNTQNPDFNFILNQQTSNTGKKKDPKIIILIVLVVLTAIVFIVGLALQPSQNVQQGRNYITGLQAEEAITKFLNYVAVEDYDGAVSLLEEGSTLDKESVQQEYTVFLSKLKLEECAANKEAQEQSSLPVFRCISKTGEIPINFVFQVVDVDGVAKIFDYQLAEI